MSDGMDANERRHAAGRCAVSGCAAAGASCRLCDAEAASYSAMPGWPNSIYIHYIILKRSSIRHIGGKRFAEPGGRRLDHTPESKRLTRCALCASTIRRAESTRPSAPMLARRRTDGRFVTPHGCAHGRSAQVPQPWNGVYNKHCRGAGAPASRFPTGRFRRRT